MPASAWDQSVSAAAILAACAGPPLLLRLAPWFPAILARSSPRTQPPPHPAWTHLVVLALQDVFVTVPIVLLLVGCIQCVKHGLASALLAALAAATLHAIYGADYFLLTRLGLRFRRHFFSYLTDLSLFANSAARMGLGLRLFALLLILDVAVMGGTFSLLFQRSGLPQVGLEALWLWLGLAACLAATAKVVPAEESVRLSNVFLQEFVTLWTKWRTPPSEPSPLQAADFATLEDFALLKPSAPLLRQTSGFTGEKLFDLSIPPGRQPHVVLLFMESFRAANVGVIGRDVSASPEFDLLARDGVLFRDFCANGIQTARAVMSSLFGILPRFTEAPAQADLHHCPRLIGLPHLLEERGYLNAYVHNGHLRFESADLFFPRQRYRHVYGCDDVQQRFPEARDLGGWGVPDEYLMRFFADWLEEQDRKGVPTFSTLFTMTNHYPFWVPEGFPVPTFDLPDNPEKTSFLETFFYSDYCLGLLARLLRNKALEEKTILFVLADTGQPVGEHGNFSEQQHLFQENIHIPLLIRAPAFLDEPAVIDEPGSQMDLLPTIMDMLGEPFRHHGAGSSLLRRNPGRSLFFNNPFGPRTVGMRTGPFKATYEFATGRSLLFDLSQDPLELRNIASEHPELSARFQRQLVNTTTFFQELYDQDRFC